MTQYSAMLKALSPEARAAVDGVHYSPAVRESGHPRNIAAGFATGVVCLLNPASVEPGDTALAGELHRDAEALLALQNDDGTIDAGNIATPPDTGFVMETLGTALIALRAVWPAAPPSEELATGGREPSEVSSDRLAEAVRSAAAAADRFMRRGAAALVTGGVHTPNHRWVVCSALAIAYRLYGEESYVRRIDEWLAEGIDIDTDGQYCERSAGIYSAVSSGALLYVALLLDRPELLEPIRRNLEATLLLTQPDGRLETTASRRQDQYTTNLTWGRYYLPLRVLAAIDRNVRFTSAARAIERGTGHHGPGSPVSRHAIAPFAFPEASAPLPDVRAGALPTDFAVHLRNAGLYRERHGDVVLSVFGGHDRWPDGRVVPEVSGRSGNPTFLTFAAGSSSVRWVRLLPRFFRVGYLRPELRSCEEGRCTLGASARVGYVQPLPPDRRRADGLYELSTADGRFWSAIALDERELSNVQSVEMDISVRMTGDRMEARFDARATTSVPVCLEIALDPDSDLDETSWDSKHARASLRHGTSGIDLGLTRERPDAWVPSPNDYGDFEQGRRATERAMHGDRMPRTLYASFLAPGSATLSITGATR
ncbi:MAG: hypothetical protein ACOCW3_03070 [Spirochaetota bacterium]